MTTTIRLGISTFPNDTFTFHALMNREVNWCGLNFEVELLNIQQLIARLFADDFDLAETSFNAALHLADRTIILSLPTHNGFTVSIVLPEHNEDGARCVFPHHARVER